MHARMVDMDNLFFNPEASLGYMTITANRLMAAHLRRSMAQSGIDLTGDQWGVLVFVWNRGSIAQDELAHAACVDKTGMSRLLAVMEQKGLVTRRPDPADARRKIISSTDKADALKERSRAVAEEVLALTQKNVSPQDYATCMRVLATVKQTLRDADR